MVDTITDQVQQDQLILIDTIKTINKLRYLCAFNLCVTFFNCEERTPGRRDVKKHVHMVSMVTVICQVGAWQKCVTDG